MSLQKIMRATVLLLTIPIAGVWAQPEVDGQIKEKVDRAEIERKVEASSVEELKRLLLQQAEEIKALRRQVSEQSGRLGQLEQKEKDAGPVPASVTTAVLRKEATTTGPVAAQASPRAAATGDAAPSPLSIRIGTAEFTPGGFLDFTSIFRSTNVGSGIGTAFGNIPFSNTAAGRLSESRLSAQNSRLKLKVDAKVSENTKVTGYVESDFLGFQPPNGHVTSNANSFRLRLYWAQVRWNKWEVLAGQSWSMLTPHRVGLSPMPEDIFITQDMDTNYQVGLTWSRASQFRLIRHFNDRWTAGIAFENPQQYVGGAVVLPNPSLYASQLDNGGNLATPNWHPDIIPKVAYDGRVGQRRVHLEAAGLLRNFRIYNPSLDARSKITGGGVSVNGNFEIVPNFRLILTSFYSAGGGRYIFGLGPDVIVRPNNTLSPVHSASTIAGFEYQSNPNLLWYGYYGGAYYQRNLSLEAGGPFGYGVPGATGANRAIQEATVGIVPTFWRNAKEYGALKLITQYSYIVRSPWSVPLGSPKNAHANMIYLNLRYELP